MMPSPAISVIFPVYNSEKYVRLAVESILNQSFQDYELIIIDDGSTDHSADIIQSIMDPRIVFFCNDENKGLVFTLNRGITNARGKYIARMDADDISLPDRFQKQVDFLESHPDIGVAGCAFRHIGEDGIPLDPIVHKPEWPLTARWQLLVGGPLAHPTAMYRTELARQVGGYDDHFTHAEDYEFWTRMAMVTDICSLPDVLFLYRISNSESISRKYTSRQILITNQIRMLAAERLFGRKMAPEISAAIQGSGAAINDMHRYAACRFLYETYQSLSGEESSAEIEELEKTASSKILLIANQIINPIYTIKFGLTFKLAKKSRYFNKWVVRLVHRFKQILGFLM